MPDTLAPRFRLENRVAMVTGATRGLGASIARALADAGAKVTVTSRDLDKAQQAATDIKEESGSPCHGLALDVRDSAGVDHAIAETVRELGGLDILVNNAGITHRGTAEELSPEQWDEVLDTNLKGAWLCSRAAHPVMRSSGWGRILNIASMFATVGLPERSPYIASKGGMAALTRALAVEFAPDGILVNALAPGPFQTDMADSRARANLKVAIPLQRWGRPEEIGPAAVFLCSDASSFITGATLPIDGGYTAR